MTTMTAALDLRRPGAVIAIWRACRSEPYRLLFAIGLLNLVIGLGLWFPAVLGDTPPVVQVAQWHMPLLLHATLDAFVLGFLFTFLPRFLQAPQVSSAGLAVVALAFLAMPVALFTGQELLASLAVFAVWSVLLGFALYRLPALRANPAPPLVLLYLGLLCGALAAAWSVVVVVGWLSAPLLTTWVRELQSHGILLLIVLGLSPVLVKRLRGGQCCGVESPGGPRLRSFVVVGVLGGIFAGSFLLGELHPIAARVGAGLRTALAVAILSRALPLHRLPRGLPMFLKGCWAAYWSMVLGLLLPALWVGHEHLIAWKHLIFVSGFLLLTLMIAARVAAAHGGRLQLVVQDRWLLGSVAVLLWLAALSRVGILWSPASRDRHLLYAAICALLAAGLWAARYLPLLWRQPRPS